MGISGSSNFGGNFGGSPTSLGTSVEPNFDTFEFRREFRGGGKFVGDCISLQFEFRREFRGGGKFGGNRISIHSKFGGNFGVPKFPGNFVGNFDRNFGRNFGSIGKGAEIVGIQISCRNSLGISCRSSQGTSEPREVRLMQISCRNSQGISHRNSLGISEPGEFRLFRISVKVPGGKQPKFPPKFPTKLLLQQFRGSRISRIPKFPTNFEILEIPSRNSLGISNRPKVGVMLFFNQLLLALSLESVGIKLGGALAAWGLC